MPGPPYTCSHGQWLGRVCGVPIVVNKAETIIRYDRRVKQRAREKVKKEVATKDALDLELSASAMLAPLATPIVVRLIPGLAMDGHPGWLHVA